MITTTEEPKVTSKNAQYIDLLRDARTACVVLSRYLSTEAHAHTHFQQASMEQVLAHAALSDGACRLLDNYMLAISNAVDALKQFRMSNIEE